MNPDFTLGVACGALLLAGLALACLALWPFPPVNGDVRVIHRYPLWVPPEYREHPDAPQAGDDVLWGPEPPIPAGDETHTHYYPVWTPHGENRMQSPRIMG